MVVVHIPTPSVHQTTTLRLTPFQDIQGLYTCWRSTAEKHGLSIVGIPTRPGLNFVTWLPYYEPAPCYGC